MDWQSCSQTAGGQHIQTTNSLVIESKFLSGHVALVLLYLFAQTRTLYMACIIYIYIYMHIQERPTIYLQNIYLHTSKYINTYRHIRLSITVAGLHTYLPICATHEYPCVYLIYLSIYLSIQLASQLAIYFVKSIYLFIKSIPF